MHYLHAQSPQLDDTIATSSFFLPLPLVFHYVICDLGFNFSNLFCFSGLGEVYIIIEIGEQLILKWKKKKKERKIGEQL